MGPNPNKLLLGLSVAALTISTIVAIQVDDVHLGTDTIWIPFSPAYIICEISTPSEGEKVMKVTWYHNDEPAYIWFENGTIFTFDPLSDRVELPSNRSDWNVKVNRLNYELEGQFKCEASNNEGESSTSNPFDFILFYNEGAEYEVVPAPTTNCQLQIQLNMPTIFPRPIGFFCRMYEDSTEYTSEIIRGFNKTELNSDDGSYNYFFNSSVQLGDHPPGSYLNCTNLVYGTEVEVFTYQPDEEPVTCPKLPDTLKGFILDRSVSILNPGCRQDRYEIGSTATYRCEKNTLVTLTSACMDSGVWDPNVNDDQVSVPTCGSAVLNASLWQVALAILFFSLKIVN